VCLISSAVVYLVREVLYDPALEPEPTTLDSTLSQTPKASDGFASLSKLDPLASSHARGPSEGVVYGRDFALKCLCKRNLSDELLVLQRGEAELHRSLPLHNNIVALHRVSVFSFFYFFFSGVRTLIFILISSNQFTSIIPGSRNAQLALPSD
jgi:hypothetical protein